MRPHICPAQALSMYRAVVRTAGLESAAYLFSISLREVVARGSDTASGWEQPVKMTLQPMIESVYADGRYGSTINYDRDLDPPLEADDARFTRELIASTRQR